VCICVESVHKFPGSKANILSTVYCGLSSLFRTKILLSQGNTAAMIIGSEQTHMSISALSVYGVVGLSEANYTHIGCCRGK
jgi:hypothetical protein